MLILKKLKQPIDLGFTIITMEYVEKKGEKNDGHHTVSKKISRRSDA